MTIWTTVEGVDCRWRHRLHSMRFLSSGQCVDRL